MEEAAIRETCEELNLVPNQIDFWGEIGYLIHQGRTIHCFVGKIKIENWEYIHPNEEVYRLFTAMFLHFGVEHLVGNMLLLIFLGDTLERVVGSVTRQLPDRHGIDVVVQSVLGGPFWERRRCEFGHETRETEVVEVIGLVAVVVDFVELVAEIGRLRLGIGASAVEDLAEAERCSAPIRSGNRYCLRIQIRRIPRSCSCPVRPRFVRCRSRRSAFR